MNHEEEHTLIAERRRKLNEMRSAGNAYPNDFRQEALANELHSEYGEHSAEALDELGKVVSVAGRLMAKRVMGKASFAKIQDRSGQLQLFVQKNSLGDELYTSFKSWDRGDIIGARGRLFKTKTGELSVWVEELRPLTKSLRPLPEKFHGLSDQETRYRQRYVDLIINDSTREAFKIRSKTLAAIRSQLDELSFMEVETPMMHPIPGGAVARPFVTHHNTLDMQLYLRIAPELYLKRLIVGGLGRVYEINRSFRNEGISTQHNPEFTMLELYQAFADYEDIMDLTENLIRNTAQTVLGRQVLDYQGVEVDLARPFERITVEESVLKYNPDLDPKRLREVEYLREVCKKLKVQAKDSYGAGKLLIEVFDATVESELMQPTFITGYPTEVSPLSRCNDNDPFVTDRFELFMTGRELANGFSELNDPEEQAERFRDQVVAKDAGDDEAMFFDDDYIRALEYGLPPTGGLGIGIDRLVMLYTNSASIRDVLLFPLMRPEV
ncbi:MAG: lysine--tRNA ligase [Chromatiales bacterium]|nr:lysine--tRNA ligase [Chromatiales bacterium]